MKLKSCVKGFFVFAMLFVTSAQCQQLVEKRVFSTKNFVTYGGKTIADVSVGWESYGKLNQDKSNVILITHYFTGTSHAAGKYQYDDVAAGYWDAIIGPGKAIDTDRFFVISIDSLANINVYDPNVTTTGPASINPDTGKPYGLTFPVITIRDFVNVQKLVLESLGITNLYAVAGPSMGSMQAIDWAVTYPNWVERMISVIGSSESDAWTTAFLEHWATPIKLDSKWNDGNYSSVNAPLDGLTASLMLITQNALTPEFFNQIGKEQLDYNALETGPLNDINTHHSIVEWLRSRAASRAKTMDANSLLYLVRACQLFLAGHQNDINSAIAKVTAKSLFLPASKDLLLMPYHARATHQKFIAHKKVSTIIEYEGPLGHLEGVSGVSQHAKHIEAFLQE